jgi:hypothetical protein
VLGRVPEGWETDAVTGVRTAHAGDAEEVGRVLADGFEADPVMGWVFEARMRPQAPGVGGPGRGGGRARGPSVRPRASSMNANTKASSRQVS